MHAWYPQPRSNINFLNVNNQSNHHTNEVRNFIILHTDFVKVSNMVYMKVVQHVYNINVHRGWWGSNKKTHIQIALICTR